MVLQRVWPDLAAECLRLARCRHSAWLDIHLQAVENFRP